MYTVFTPPGEVATDDNYYYKQEGLPIYIKEVYPNGWADTNGVEAGDEIWQGKRENDLSWTSFKDLTLDEQNSLMDSRPLYLRMKKYTGEF